MKMVVAVVQDHMAQQVVDALHRIPDVTGATFSAVRGFGRGRRRDDDDSVEDLIGTLPRTRVEVVARDGVVPAVVAAIRSAAHTGKRGDGKVFVLPVETALRISNGDTGDVAL